MNRKKQEEKRSFWIIFTVYVLGIYETSKFLYNLNNK